MPWCGQNTPSPKTDFAGNAGGLNTRQTVKRTLKLFHNDLRSEGIITVWCEGFDTSTQDIASVPPLWCVTAG